MADKTGIEWTDATWNPVTGCSVVSAGCTNCYAMRLAGTRLKNHPSRAGLTIDTKAGPVWNGQVRFNDAWLDQPLRWSRPRTVFVCAHGDLFHPEVSDEQIDRVFAVMILAHQHRFQILTKRAERMRDYLLRHRWHLWAAAARRIDHRRLESLPPIMGGDCTPVPNVWLGVSAEDQRTADERLDMLTLTPAAIRFVSAEPLLGEIDLTPWLHDLHWVIAGGESGPHARVMHPDWARSLRDQCRRFGVPFFFKQWGEWAWFEKVGGGRLNIPFHAGKANAGRELDGVEHLAMPGIA